ncbi:MAG: carboxypeptidase regulatory-like domain-containing protein [Polyangiaceae bacterium]|nr:carboxypeptidase regulatory-like domain-containing protein [Polyangiaceae bacterium]
MSGLFDSALSPPLLSMLAPPVPVELLERDAALHVLVTDADGAPRTSAAVRVFAMIGDKAHFAGEAMTGADGRASFTLLPRGEVWVVAYDAGRARASTRAILEKGPRDVTLVLATARALDVVVVDGDDAPIEGAEIVVAAADPLPFLGRTGDDGRARMDRLGPGPFTVRVSADGYDDVVRTGVVTENGPLRIKMERLGTLVVSVIGVDGGPAEGAEVWAAGTGLWPARSAVTDASGVVRIAGLSDGAFDLKAKKDDAVSATEIAVRLKRGEEKQVELRLNPGRHVLVKVTDGEGENAPVVAGASVLLVEHGLSSFPLLGKTNEKGLVSLGPIADEPASVSARAKGFVQTSAVPVGILDDEVQVPLLRGAVVIGEVRDDRDFPIAGATIEIVGSDPWGMPIDEVAGLTEFRDGQFSRMMGGPAPLIPMGELGVMPGPIPDLPREGAAFAALPSVSEDAWVTRSDGAFRAEPVTPGRIQVIARHPAYVDGASEIVSLAPGGEVHIKIVLKQGGSLEGRVVEEDRTPVAGARVELVATTGSLERVTFAADDGTFAFAAVPEEVIVSVARPSEPADVVARIVVTVNERGRNSIEIVLPKARDAVRIRVTDDRGYALDRVEIHALSLDLETPLRRTAFTDDDGQTELPGAVGLPLRLTFSRSGKAPKVQTVDSAPGEMTVQLALGITAKGTVTGREGRERLENADVVVYTMLGPKRTQTDVEGAFEVKDLAPGPVRISASKEGFADSEIVAQLGDDPDRPTDVGAIDLLPAGEVSGVVVDENDDPVAGARVAKDSVPSYLPLGALPAGIVVTDREGRFVLTGLPEGTVTLEAYTADRGRGQVENVPVRAERTTSRVKIVLPPIDEEKKDVRSSGSVAVTLGERDGRGAKEIMVVMVAPGSEAEIAGLLAGDQITHVNGRAAKSIEGVRKGLSGPLAEDVLVSIVRSPLVPTRGAPVKGEAPAESLLVRVRRERVRR